MTRVLIALRIACVLVGGAMSLGGALLALLAWSMLMDEPVRRGRWGHLIMLMGVVGLVASMVGMVLFAVGLVWRPGRGRPRTVAV